MQRVAKVDLPSRRRVTRIRCGMGSEGQHVARVLVAPSFEVLVYMFQKVEKALIESFERTTVKGLDMTSRKGGYQGK